jgi:aerotaxis receptor
MCQLESTLNKASAPDASMEWLLAELDKQGHSYESFVLSLLDPHLSTGRSA